MDDLCTLCGAPFGPIVVVVAPEEPKDMERARSGDSAPAAIVVADAVETVEAVSARGVEASRKVLDDWVAEGIAAPYSAIGRVRRVLGLLRGEETLVAAESGRPLSPLLSESTDWRSGAKRASVAAEADANRVSVLLALSVLLRDVGAGDGDGDEALGSG